MDMTVASSHYYHPECYFGKINIYVGNLKEISNDSIQKSLKMLGLEA